MGPAGKFALDQQGPSMRMVVFMNEAIPPPPHSLQDGPPEALSLLLHEDSC